MREDPMNDTRRLALDVAKGLLLILVTVVSLAMLYEVASHYQGRDLGVKWVVLTVFPAAYLWWVVERVLRRLNVQRSAAYSLLIALALSVWLLAVSEKLALSDRAGSLLEVIWDGLEATFLFFRRLLP